MSGRVAANTRENTQLRPRWGKAPQPISARAELYAKVLMRAISTEYPNADYVTREDLIQMRIFQHVSTITRYAAVCTAARILIDKGQLIAGGRTDLIIPGRRRNYHADESLSQRYADTIRATCRAMTATKFDLMDIVDAWTTDQHLTTNHKRVAVRGAIHALVKEKIIAPAGDFQYRRLAS